MFALFKPFRSQDEAKAMVGKRLTIGSQIYQVTSFNDLGCLYGVKVKGNKVGKIEYVLD